MLVIKRKRRKNQQKDQAQVSNNFKLPSHRCYQFIQCISCYAEKAKQAPAASSTDLELGVQTNEHQYQSSQDAQGNATIGRPYYYQVHRNKFFSIFFLALNRSCTYILHVQQAFPTAPIQANQMYMHPNMHTMPLCTPQVLIDRLDSTYFSYLAKINARSCDMSVMRGTSFLFNISSCFGIWPPCRWLYAFITSTGKKLTYAIRVGTAVLQ